MPQHFSLRMGLLPPALLLALAGCSGQETSPPPAESTSASPTAPTPAPPATTPSPSPTPTPSAVRRTSAQLKSALLGLKDLPAGFEVEKSGGDDDGTKVSSSKKACAPLVRLMNSDTVAGSRAQAERSFSGGQEGPFVDETLDAMGEAQAARTFVQDYRTSVKACRSVRVSLAGVGSSDVAVRELSFGKMGGETFAGRFRAEGGALDGLEIIQVGVQAGDVVVGVTTVGLGGPDAEAATEDAVHKARKKLGTAESI